MTPCSVLRYAGMSWKDCAEIAEHWATVVALLVGGGWVLYQYVIRRSGETGLAIDVTSRVTPHAGGRQFLFFEVTLKNTGQRRLDASRQSPSQLAGQYEGSVHRAGSLQVREVEALPAGKVSHLNWWAAGAEGIGSFVVPEIDLLAEYTDPEGRIEFFMEPGEEYRLGSPLILNPGVYLAKIVFIGRRAQEYWSRIVPLVVESPNSALAADAHKDARG
jgi:hypothetical protein